MEKKVTPKFDPQSGIFYDENGPIDYSGKPRQKLPKQKSAPPPPGE